MKKKANPDTRVSRQPAQRPSELSSAQLELYQAITDGPRSGGAFSLTDSAGRLQGPFGGFLLSPRIGDAMQRLGAAIRYHSGLTPRVRELAILVVAGHHSSPFERFAHEAVGRTVGLSEVEMDAAVNGQMDPFSEPSEVAALRVTRSILAGDIDEETWHACVPPLTPELVFELLALVGYYSTLAVQMRVLRADAVPNAQVPTLSEADVPACLGPLGGALPM